MKYLNELGIKGNLDKIYNELKNQKNNSILKDSKLNECIVKIEQEATETYLNNVEVQQAITDLELKILGG